MCGRYTLKDLDEFLKAVFAIHSAGGFINRYNIAPTQNVPVIIKSEKEPILLYMRWGLIPSWAKDTSYSAKMINARAETLKDKPSFSDALKRRRCLIPCSGFYEWKRTGKNKQPYYIQMNNGSHFVFAGLWDVWQVKDQTIQSCTIITTAANTLVSCIHQRMPVILKTEQYDKWLSGEQINDQQTKEYFAPYDSDRMKLYKVSSRVNSYKYDDESCIEPLELFF